MSSPAQKVAVLGASDKPERYSYKAVQMLSEAGHLPIPVHPSLKSLDNLPVFPSLEAISEPVDTLTIYLNPDISTSLKDAIVEFNPGRVIFNPGTENPDLQASLDEHAIPWQEACTLVLLRTGQF